MLKVVSFSLNKDILPGPTLGANKEQGKYSLNILGNPYFDRSRKETNERATKEYLAVDRKR